jgi:hypothetical protein
VIKHSLVVAALGGLIALPGCASTVSAPPVTQVNVAAQSKLQFQVGTANLAGTPGLNTVVTFRQPSGISAVLADTPTITLPAGFTNTAPAAVAGTDSGTNHISGTPQTIQGASTLITTFGQATGAFSYGFLDANSIAGGNNNSLFYQTPATDGPSNVLGPDPTAASGTLQPIYQSTAASATLLPFAPYVGPGNSFVSNFNNGTVLTSFHGPPSGFTTFALAPIAGAYSLSVAIASTNATVPSFTSTTSLTSVALLPAMPAAVFTSDGLGGGTVAINVPAGVTETAVFIKDVTTATYYTLVTKTTGAQTLTLPDNIGMINAAGVAGMSLNPPIPASGGNMAVPGDTVHITVVGFDYPAMEAVPAAPFGATPVQVPIVNNGGAACTFSSTTSTCTGQADVTISPTTAGTE